MNPFVYYSPTRYVFGPEAEMETGRHAGELGIGSVLIVYGQGSVVRSGLLGRVKASWRSMALRSGNCPASCPTPCPPRSIRGLSWPGK